MEALLTVLIPLLITVESQGNDLAQGDMRNGRYMAIGCLQIWPDYWTDGTEYLKVDWEYKDAYKRSRAIEVAKAYLTRYGKHYERTTGNKATLEVLSRSHNGGPQGWNPEYPEKYGNTTKYWNKVKGAM